MIGRFFAGPGRSPGLCRQGRALLWCTICLALLLAGCAAPPDQIVLATRDALSDRIAGERTAAALAAAATTPAPATPTDAPPTATGTPRPSPTATLDRPATHVAQTATATAIAQVTAAAEDPIRAALPAFGVDGSRGEVAWIHPPTTIEATGYMTYTYANQNLLTVAKDFVLQSDITWNTQYGSTGCGFVVRSNGQEEAFDQYIILATRAGNGHVLFTIMEDGRLRRNELFDWYAGAIDPNFDWRNDTTNRLTIVGRGNTFEIFTNGKRLGEFTPSRVFERGFIALVALNESGTTTCQFDNTWLWLIE